MSCAHAEFIVGECFLCEAIVDETLETVRPAREPEKTLPPRPAPLIPPKTQGPDLGALEAAYLEERAKRAAKARAKRVEECRADFKEYVRDAWHVIHGKTRMKWGRHIEVLCDHYQALTEELLRAREDESYTMKAQNLLVNIPPRMLKSIIFSVLGPTWDWAREPELKIRVCSGNPRLVSEFSEKVEQIITSDWYASFRSGWDSSVEGTECDSDDEWEIKASKVAKRTNTKGGEIHFTSMNMKVTGEGTEKIQWDDPHDATEALSETKREAILTKWKLSLENRVNDERACARIGIMQRLHEADLSGYCIDQGTWQHVCLPMEYEEHAACECTSCTEGTWIGWKDWRTEDGELLHPDRFPAKSIPGHKKRLGSMGYAGQMQQRPAPSEGNFFKKHWWNWWRPDGKARCGNTPRPHGCDQRPARALNFDQLHEQLMSVDCAFIKSEDGSRVSILVIGTIGSSRFLLDNITQPMSFPETVQGIKNTLAKWPKIAAKLIEKKANGDAVLATLEDKVGGLIPINPEGGKESRAAAASPYVEAGDWYLPDGADWVPSFVLECATFPNGAKDDQVDALTQACNYLQDSSDYRMALGLASVPL